MTDFLLCGRAEGRFDFERRRGGLSAGSIFSGVFWFCKRVGVLMAFSSSPLISLSQRFGRADTLLLFL